MHLSAQNTFSKTDAGDIINADDKDLIVIIRWNWRKKALARLGYDRNRPTKTYLTHSKYAREMLSA